MKNPVSAVIITKNEEKRIAATVKALHWCDEILVVDSGSTDKTVDICTQSGCNVQHHAFENYGKQKHYAASLAKNNWVLVIDADEIVTPALADEIQQLLATDNALLHGYRIKISLVFMGKLLRFGGEYNKLHLRLFNKLHGQYNSDSVHEDIIIEGKAGELTNRILHYSYNDLQDYFNKFNQYTSLAAGKMDGKRSKSSLYIALKFPLTFLHMYFLRGLILDGYPGFVWAMLCSFYPFVKYVKHREMAQLSRQASIN